MVHYLTSHCVLVIMWLDSLEEVRNVLKSFGSSYTISSDGFLMYLLYIYKLIGKLAKPIYTLFNMSLTQGAITDYWK